MIQLIIIIVVISLYLTQGLYKIEFNYIDTYNVILYPLSYLRG